MKLYYELCGTENQMRIFNCGNNAVLPMIEEKKLINRNCAYNEPFYDKDYIQSILWESCLCGF